MTACPSFGFDHPSTMRKTLLLLLAGAACGGAASCRAETPEPGLMPDGSYDMYAGLGMRSAPNYEGGADRKQRAMPVLQAGWSNGAFISGMNAGWHLSATPGLEYGPLLSVHEGRSQHGSTLLDGAIAITNVGNPGMASTAGTHLARASYRLRDIGARVEGGFFVNYYLADRLRITSSVLAGAGEERNGARWIVGLQRGAIELAPHHTLALSAGATIGNRAYNTAYFGLRTDDVLAVTPVVVSADGKPAAPEWAYTAGGGIKDLHLGARWNWAMSPSWMLVTNVQVTQLRGGARNSPLTDRATGVSVSTALAYRF